VLRNVKAEASVLDGEMMVEFGRTGRFHHHLDPGIATTAFYRLSRAAAKAPQEPGAEPEPRYD
jgi:hypothetical protein